MVAIKLFATLKDVTRRLKLDDKIRSLVKSITYRVVSFTVLMILAWVVTGNFVQTTVISVTFHIIQLAAYYIHERAWQKIGWG